jgi:hypothetical protein
MSTIYSRNTLKQTLWTRSVEEVFPCFYGTPRFITPGSHFIETFRNRDDIIATWLSVTIDGVWIVNRIYWTLTLVTTNNYDSLTFTHSKNHCNYSTHEVFSVFITRCLVAASNGGCFPSSRFPNYPQLQLPASHFSQLTRTTSPPPIAPARIAQKTSLPVLCVH